MKYLWLICLGVFIIPCVDASIVLTDGGGEGLTILRNPFYLNTGDIVDVSITSPVTQVYYVNTIWTNFTISGGSQPYSCYVSLNGVSFTGINCYYQLVTYPDGVNTVYVVVIDQNGNIGYDSQVFTVSTSTSGGEVLEELIALGAMAAFFCLIIIGYNERKKKSVK
jgi:hypothetical protein